MIEEPLQVDVVLDGSSAHVRLTGEIDDSNAGTLNRLVEDHAASEVEIIELDLSAVTYLGSAGVRALVETADNDAGLTVTVVGASDIVRRVLELTGLRRLLAAPSRP